MRRGVNIISMGEIEAWPSYAQCLQGRGIGDKIMQTHLPKHRPELQRSTCPSMTSQGMLRFVNNKQSQAQCFHIHSTAVTETCEAAHHQTGLLLSVAYIHHVRGIRILLQRHFCNWQADTRYCLSDFSCLFALWLYLIWISCNAVVHSVFKEMKEKPERQNLPRADHKKWVNHRIMFLQAKLNWIHECNVTKHLTNADCQDNDTRFLTLSLPLTSTMPQAPVSASGGLKMTFVRILDGSQVVCL